MTCHIYFTLRLNCILNLAHVILRGFLQIRDFSKVSTKVMNFCVSPMGVFLGPKPSIFPTMAPSNCHDVMLPSFQIIKPYSPENNMTMEKQPFEDVPTIYFSFQPGK